MTSSSSMITPVLLIRTNLDYLSCFITILLNIVFILKILRRKTLRTSKNLLLINSYLNLICSCLTLLISVTLTLSYSIFLHFNLHLCWIIGYLMNSFYHGITYSYVLLSINIFQSKKYNLSKFLIIFEIIIQWILAFFISFFLNQIHFQIKGRFCYTRQRSLMLFNLLTGLVLPIIFMLIFNLITYVHLHILRMNTNVMQQQKSVSFRQLSYRLYRRQNQKHIKLLHQTMGFFSVVFLGWGIFILMSILDRYQIIPDDIYLFILSFPSISLLTLTLLINYWNKPAKKSLFTSNSRHSLSATTIRFSPSIDPNHIDFI